MKNNITQQEIWNEIAKSWHSYRQKPWKDLEKAMFSFLEGESGRVLEIGCGNGRNLIPFAERGFDCYGVDFSEDMLRHAAELAAKNKVNVKLKYGRAENIPFGRDFFDYALDIAVLHHLKKENQLQALKEIYRVLSNNGKALITVWNKFNPKFWKYIFRKSAFIPWKFEGKVYNRFYYFFSYFELKSLIRKAGFKIIKASSPFAKNLSFVVKKNGKTRRNY